MRTDPSREDVGSYGRAEHTELWLRAKDGTERKIVDGRSVVEGESDGGTDVDFGIVGISDPFFAIDAQRVFFTGAAWVVTPATYVVEVGTGSVHLLTDGISHLIAEGPYRGGRSRDRAFRPTPSTDPDERFSRIRLLPQVVTPSRLRG